MTGLKQVSMKNSAAGVELQEARASPEAAREDPTLHLALEITPYHVVPHIT